MSIPTVAGRTPIACLNCASAKTGCDKRVPCSRCADKSLPCSARFARRSSKLIARAIAASESAVRVAQTNETKPAQQSIVFNSPKPLDLVIDPRLQSTPGMGSALSPQVFSSETFSEPSSAKFDGFDDFMQYNDGITSPGMNYQDFLTWNDFSMDVDLYTNFTSLPSESVNPMYSDLGDISSGSDISSASTRNRLSIPPTRSCSISSVGDLDFRDMPQPKRAKLSCCAAAPKFEEVLAAESAWPLARCNPPTSTDPCPRTAVMHLENLEEFSRHEHAWSSLDLDVDQVPSSSDSTRVEHISLGAGDALHTATQGFLQRALKTYRGEYPNKCHNGGYPSPGTFSFSLLPPTNVLEHLLSGCARSLSTYYSLTAAGRVDPIELTHHSEASTLLILLMIAQGATTSGSAEARCLSAGLMVTCRASLFEIIERDVEFRADTIVLRCALLSTMLGAWSGDKWHMDIAMGQRGTYLTMLKHAGMLEQQVMILSTLNGISDPEAQWRAWLQTETRSRYVEPSLAFQIQNEI